MKLNALTFLGLVLLTSSSFAKLPGAMQSVLLISESSPKLCSATYLGRGDIFVTAAHCTNLKPSYVYLGADPAHPDPHQIIKIKAVFQNPSYTYGNWAEDVGFVVLERKLPEMLKADLMAETALIPLKSPLSLAGYHGNLRTEKSLLSAGEDSGNLIAACAECGAGDSGAGVFYNGKLAGVFSAMTDKSIRSLIAPIKASQIAWLKKQLSTQGI